jgi:hypothetical protein
VKRVRRIPTIAMKEFACQSFSLPARFSAVSALFLNTGSLVARHAHETDAGNLALGVEAKHEAGAIAPRKDPRRSKERANWRKQCSCQRRSALIDQAV